MRLQIFLRRKVGEQSSFVRQLLTQVIDKETTETIRARK